MADGIWEDVKGLFGLRGTARVPEGATPARLSPGTALDERQQALDAAREEMLMQTQRLQGAQPPAPAAAPQPAPMTEQELRAPATGAIPGLPTPAAVEAWRAPQVPVQQGTLRSINPTVPRRDEESPIRIYRSDGVRG